MAYQPMITDTSKIDHLAVILGSVEQIRDVLCGAQQHNEHCKGYRWFQYMADVHKREQAVREESRKIIAARGMPDNRHANPTITACGRAEEGVRRLRF